MTRWAAPDDVEPQVDPVRLHEVFLQAVGHGDARPVLVVAGAAVRWISRAAARRLYGPVPFEVKAHQVPLVAVAGGRVRWGHYDPWTVS